MIDFEGKIALVFFTQGCNFKCGYCHNPELIEYKNNNNMSYEQLGVVLDQGRNNWVDGICITGGEPTMQPALPETISFIKAKGMDVKLDTQGSLPEALGNVISFCDYIAMDYKMPIEKYQLLTHVAIDHKKIMKSLDLLKDGQIDYEIRTTVIPGIHFEEDIKKICAELNGIKKFVLQTFVPRDTLPDLKLRTTESTPREMLDAFADICRNHFEEVIIR